MNIMFYAFHSPTKMIVSSTFTLNSSRAHHPVVVQKKGLPASLERRMLYLTFGYPRGAPLCFSGMFGVEFRWGGSRSCLTEIESD